MAYASITAVTTPRSRAKLGLRLEEIAELLKQHGDVDVVTTERVGHARELSRAAAKGEAELVVAIGGDGTLHEVANGILDTGRGAEELPVFMGIPAGAGNDFLRSFGVHHHDMQQLGRRLSMEPQTIDVGLVTVLDGDGAEQERRHFLSVGAAAYAARVNDRAVRDYEWTGGLRYTIAGVLEVIAGPNVALRFRCDDGEDEQSTLSMFAVANTEYFGSGMQIAPTASPTDGRFDLVLGHTANRLAFFSVFPRVFRGKHLSSKLVELRECQRVTVHQPEVAPIVVDGETMHGQTAVFEVQPQRLRVVV